MTAGAILFLLQTYWPFLLIAVVIGVATGWYSQPEVQDAEASH